MTISIPEDATAIIEKREFNLIGNSVLGGSLQLGDNSLPDCKSGGAANSVKYIVQYFKLYKAAKVMFVIMAQLMPDFSAVTEIGSFASDNKRTSLDVKNRDTYIT
jgi:hypothetical protein